MKEDFALPLREALSLYRRSPGIGDDRIRIYQRAELWQIYSENSGINFLIKFQAFTSKRLKDDELKYGSLLCISNDGFKTFAFATITNTDKRSNLMIDVRIESGVEVLLGRSPSCRYVVAECVAYFEAYRHVLQGLQQVESTTPFQRYIVRVKKEMRAPAYVIKREQQGHEYNFQSHYVDKQDNSDESNHSANTTKKPTATLTDSSSWPSAAELGLNESQLEAMQHALTSELAIIQGPPGTGKTYVGLKIVKALLANKSYHENSPKVATHGDPILVICHTNHALDQFLEEILKFCGNVVRMGTRSKSTNKKLADHNMKTLKKEDTNNYKEQEHIAKAKKVMINNVDRILEDLDGLERKLHYSSNGILSSKQLQRYMTSKAYKFFQQRRNSMSKWLGCHNLAHCGQCRYVQEGGRCIGDDGDLELYVGDYKTSENRSLSAVDRQVEDVRNELRYTSETAVEGKKYATTHPNQLHKHERWSLYRYWTHQYKEVLRQKFRAKEQEYNQWRDVSQEWTQQKDQMILRRADVIGMTTSAAARLRNVLQNVRPRIIIVEEAAEVLESHIITALNDGCEHLILIGDHKQLRPKTTVHHLATDFHLNISLFERLVRNGLKYVTLKEQRRMCPEISCLLQHIYGDSLRDHDSVREYDDVRGMKHNCFFLDHKNPESLTHHDKQPSYKNDFEANFIVELAQYLIYQRYRTSNITVLTPYGAQVSLLKRTFEDRRLGDVRIATVDGYQGEENDIVLVSLVRSSKIGFLAEANRTCMLLSRAKKGMYVIGNFNTFSNGSTLWQKLVTTMQSHGRYGDALQVYCHNHSDDVAEVKHPNHFKNRPDGCCGKPCDYLLECGHRCSMKCHNFDKAHANVTCRKGCTINHRSNRTARYKSGKQSGTSRSDSPSRKHALAHKNRGMAGASHYRGKPFRTTIDKHSSEKRHSNTRTQEVSSGNRRQSRCSEPNTRACPKRSHSKTTENNHRQSEETSRTNKTLRLNLKCEDDELEEGEILD